MIDLALVVGLDSLSLFCKIWLSMAMTNRFTQKL